MLLKFDFYEELQDISQTDWNSAGTKIYQFCQTDCQDTWYFLHFRGPFPPKVYVIWIVLIRFLVIASYQLFWWNLSPEEFT